MNRSLAMVLGIGLLSQGCGPKEAGTAPPPASGSAQSADKSGGGNPLTAPVDYLGAVGRAKTAAVNTLDLAGLNQAIQLFHVQEDRLPATLDELVTKKYLPHLPTPPAGRRFSYNPATGEIRLIAQ